MLLGSALFFGVGSVLAAVAKNFTLMYVVLQQNTMFANACLGWWVGVCRELVEGVFYHWVRF